MSVQWVNRPDLDFRGFAGRIIGGVVRPGDPIRVLPAGRTTTVQRIVTYRRRPRGGRGRPVGHPDPGRRDRRQPGRRAGRGRRRPRGGRPVRGPPHLDERAGDAPGPPLPHEARQPDGRGHGEPTQVQGQRQHPGAHGGQRRSSSTRSGCATSPSTARPLRPLRGQPGDGRLHPHRPADQQHGRRRPAPLRAAAIRERALAGLEVDREARADLKGQRPVRGVVHRPLRRREVDHRQHRREAAPRLRPAHLPARRRQRPPRPEQGPRVHRRRPGREHPAGGRGGLADGRRRPHRAGLPHLAVRGRAADGPGAHRATTSSARSTSTPRWPSPRSGT